ncbi:hypothetical protein KR093_009792, partial [Drosophila rubida]
QRLIIECEQDLQLTQIPELVIPIMGKTALHMNNQNIAELPNTPLYGYHNLSELHLANNQLTQLAVAQLPPNLTYLDISNNNLSTLDQSVLNYFSNPAGIRLKLAGNPWICTCDNEAFLLFIHMVYNKRSTFDVKSETLESQLFQLQELQRYKKLRQILLREYIIYDNILKLRISAIVCMQPCKCAFIVDINKKHCPNNCKCEVLECGERLIIECEQDLQLTQIPELVIPIMGKTALHMNNQNIAELPNTPLYGYHNLSELHLANNQLTHLTVAQLPPNLTYLDLSNNNLSTLDQSVLNYFSNRAGIRLKLAGNPWICTCDNEAFLLFVSEVDKYNIEDRQNITCDRIVCGLLNNNYFIFCVGSAVVIVIVIGLYLYYKKSIIMWLYERNIFINFINRLEPESSNIKKFDAFLAFSHGNIDLIEEYVEKLENGPREFKLCFYQRDWVIGASIPQCILDSIDESKRVIILLTEDFLKSTWGLFELRTAIRATNSDEDKRLIVILYPGVEIDALDSELRIFLKFNTYLARDDPYFWRKLIYAMPHKPRRQQI